MVATSNFGSVYIRPSIHDQSLFIYFVVWPMLFSLIFADV